MWDGMPLHSKAGSESPFEKLGLQSSQLRQEVDMTKFSSEKKYGIFSC